MDELITTQQAADELGLSTGRILAMIRDGMLPAQTFGARTKLIRRADLELVRNRPKPGRRWPEKPAPKKKGRKKAT